MTTIDGELSRARGLLRDAREILLEEQALGLDYGSAIRFIGAALSNLPDPDDNGSR